MAHEYALEPGKKVDWFGADLPGAAERGAGAGGLPPRTRRVIPGVLLLVLTITTTGISRIISFRYPGMFRHFGLSQHYRVRGGFMQPLALAMILIP